MIAVYAMKNNQSSNNNVKEVGERKIDICFFSHSAQMGGSERSLLELLMDLSCEGISCHVLLPGSGDIENELKKLQISYDVIPFRWWTLSGGEDRQAAVEEIILQSANIFEKISKINPDLIYTNTSVINAGSIVAKEMNVPHVWHVREFGELDHNLDFILNEEKRARYIDDNSDFVIFNSNAVKNYYLKYAAFKKSDVIYNNAAVPKSGNCERLFKKESSFRIVIVGSIHPGKGQKDAIIAVKELIFENNNIELAVVGNVADDLYAQECRDLIREEMDGKVFFTGYMENGYRAMEESDAVLVCSHNEAFGRVTAEAMSIGKPVIGSNSGGTAELIKNEENGLLYEPGNIQQLKEKIMLLVNDPQKRNEISKKALEFASINFSKDNYSHKIKKAIEAMTDKNTFKYIDDFQFVKNNLLRGFSKKHSKAIEEKELTIRQMKILLEKKNKELDEIRTSLRWKIPNFIYKKIKAIFGFKKKVNSSKEDNEERN